MSPRRKPDTKVRPWSTVLAAVKSRIKPVASIAALATALNMEYRVHNYWRVCLVSAENETEVVFGEYFDPDEALEVMAWLNGELTDDEDEDKPAIPGNDETAGDARAVMYGPFVLIEVECGADAEGGIS